MDLWIVMIQVSFVMVQVEDLRKRNNRDVMINILDDSGRYAYDKQPSICKWNCGKLAEALGPFLPLQRSKTILAKFDEEYQRVYMTKMRQKVKFLLLILKCEMIFLPL